MRGKKLLVSIAENDYYAVLNQIKRLEKQREASRERRKLTNKNMVPREIIPINLEIVGHFENDQMVFDKN